MTAPAASKYNVGGILLDRPFKIWRLGHFGFNTDKMEESLHFYTDLLGFRVSDQMRLGYFLRYGSDHHSHVLFSKKTMEELGGPPANPEVDINQITWQVGSLAQVVQTHDWFASHDVRIRREGRDMPGSNWHTYIFDPDNHIDELYYGIEQEGWAGHSKPLEAYQRGFREIATLPQMSEADEVQSLLADGVDIMKGFRHVDAPPAKYDVDGVLLSQPFKITKIGPVNLFVDDVEQAKSWYSEILGLTLTEEAEWQGEKAAYFRCNTEHHSLGLLPKSWRSKLGLIPNSTCASFGLQLANYRQLRDAVSFLRENGVRVETDIIPPELHPGIDYAAYAFDPDGHAVELYCSMEQIGWTGRPRSKAERTKVDPKNWPAALEAKSDSYSGEVLFGPWN